MIEKPPPDPTHARDQVVALCRRSPGAGDGAGRRRDPAYGIRPVDHRMEAGDGRGAAALRQFVAGSIRKISGHSAIPRAQSRHEPRRVSDDLLVGMGAPAARSRDRRRVSPAIPVVSLARRRRAGFAPAIMVHFRARRTARRGRLVDGRLRPCRARRGFAIPAGDASPPRVPDLCRADLDGVALARTRGIAAAGPHSRHGRRAHLSRVDAGLSRRARCRICAPATPTTPGR